MSDNNLSRTATNNSHVYVVVPGHSQNQLESHANSQFSQLSMINHESLSQHISLQTNSNTMHQSAQPFTSSISSGSLNQNVQLAQTLEQINHFPPKQREAMVNSVLASVIKSTSELQGSLQNIVKLVNSILINQNAQNNPILLQQQNIDQQSLGNNNFYNQHLQSVQQQPVVNLSLPSHISSLSSYGNSNVFSNESPLQSGNNSHNASIQTILQELNNIIQKENNQSQLNGVSLPAQGNEVQSISAINNSLSDVLLSSSSSPKSCVKSPNQDYFTISSSTSSPPFSQNNFDLSVKMSPSVDSPANSMGSSSYPNQSSASQNENKTFECGTSTIRSLLSNPSLQWKPSNPSHTQSQSSFNSCGFISDSKTSGTATTDEPNDKSKSHRVPPGSLLIADSANHETVASSADEQTESCSPHSSPCDSPRVSTWNMDALWQDSDTQISTIRRSCNNLNLNCNTNGGCNASCSDSVDDETAVSKTPSMPSTSSMPRVWRLASGNGSAVESGINNQEGEATVGLPPTKLWRSTTSYETNADNVMQKRCTSLRKKKFSQRSLERDGRVSALLTDPDSDQQGPIQKTNPSKTLKRLSQYKCSNVKVRMPSLQQQFPSSYGQVQLVVVTQPEEQHRARYMTEGSRGAIKDRSGNRHPEVQLIGWNNPFTLQVFLATDIGRVRPHGFYQSCKVFGKSSTPCNEIDCDGTNVIEIPCIPPDTAVTTVSLDCVGILKLRNADVEHRVGPRGSKNKSVRARLVFRVSLPRPDGSQITLQTVSEPILCTQPIGSPEISRISLTNGHWKGGYDLFIIGKNFTKGTKVLFQEVQEDQATPLWEAEATIDSEYFQQNHLICEVPSFKCELKIPVTVQIIVQCSKRVSEPHYFSYIPEGTSEEVSNSSQPYPEFVQISCQQGNSQVEESSMPLIISSSSGQMNTSHSSNQLIPNGTASEATDIDIAKSIFNHKSEWGIEPTVTNQSNWSVSHNDCNTSDWPVHHTSNTQNWTVSQLPASSEQSWEEVVVSNSIPSQPNSDNTWNQSQDIQYSQVLPTTSVELVSGDLKASSVTNSSTFTISEQLNHQNFANNLSNGLNNQPVNNNSVDVQSWDPSLPAVSYEQMDWTKSGPDNNHFLTAELDHSQLEFLNVIPEETSSLDKSEEINASNNADNPILTYADVTNYFDI